MSIKEEIMKSLVTSLARLPDDATLEDIEYHTAFVLMIERRRTEVRAGKTITHEEVRARMKRWLE